MIPQPAGSFPASLQRSAALLTRQNDTMGNTCKYQDWRELGPVATNFSQDIAATWASNPRAIPSEIKDAMQAAQTALCALDDLIQEHVREELGDD
jgi:hypothetical protein